MRSDRIATADSLVLGGLLAAYDLSGHDELYLRKAVELGDRLLCVFDTPSGIAASFVDLAKRELIYDRDSSSGAIDTAEPRRQ